jgi:hypothetical protein
MSSWPFDLVPIVQSPHSLFYLITVLWIVSFYDWNCNKLKFMINLLRICHVIIVHKFAFQHVPYTHFDARINATYWLLSTVAEAGRYDAKSAYPFHRSGRPSHSRLSYNLPVCWISINFATCREYFILVILWYKHFVLGNDRYRRLHEQPLLSHDYLNDVCYWVMVVLQQQRRWVLLGPTRGFMARANSTSKLVCSESSCASCCE